MNEKINTWRTLQELPPAVSSVWCQFNWHTWTKWSDPQKNSIYSTQTKMCIHCNRQKTKRWEI